MLEYFLVLIFASDFQQISQEFILWKVNQKRFSHLFTVFLGINNKKPQVSNKKLAYSKPW